MNIFYLDKNPKLAAEYHCDKHVVKMILETAQLLSGAHHSFNSPDAINCYKPTHMNHPCSIWVRSSGANYYWTFELFYHLSLEFLLRRGKVHASWEKLGKILKNPPITISNIPFYDPPQCMPDEYKHPSTVEAYRSYYLGDKSSFAKWEWNNAITPYWWNNVTGVDRHG